VFLLTQNQHFITLSKFNTTTAQMESELHIFVYNCTVKHPMFNDCVFYDYDIVLCACLFEFCVHYSVD